MKSGGGVSVQDRPASIKHVKYLMRLNGWMTKTPLSSCRMHSFSTAISLPYTYSDCLFSCGRSRALHPQVAVVHPTVGPLSFSMARARTPSDQPNARAILPPPSPSGFCSGTSGVRLYQSRPPLSVTR